jgi:hypothetical protein
MSSATPAPPSSIGTEQHFRWLLGIVKVVLVLNLFDAIFTLIWVYAGLAREANPLLAEVILEHPVLFAAAKIGVVTLASLFLWRLRNRPLAVVGIFLAFLVYYGLFLYHVGYLSLLVRNTWF